MPNWLIAAHGYAQQKPGAVREALAPTEKFRYGVTIVPPLIELVVYTPQNTIMGMKWGWQLWYQLAYNMYGGESAAYSEKHKSKKGLSVVPDYRTMGDSTFPTGVFQVGCASDVNKVIDIPTGGGPPLSDILAKAFKASGVKRVYWLCCTQLDLTAPTMEISGAAPAGPPGAMQP
jgi:hypothetical protein